MMLTGLNSCASRKINRRGRQPCFNYIRTGSLNFGWKRKRKAVYNKWFKTKPTAFIIFHTCENRCIICFLLTKNSRYYTKIYEYIYMVYIWLIELSSFNSIYPFYFLLFSATYDDKSQQCCNFIIWACTCTHIYVCVFMCVCGTIFLLY